MKAIKIAFFLLPLLVIYSCQPKSDKSGEDMEGTALKEEFKKLLPGFPTAMDFAAHLQATGADFNPAFLNDTAKASAYVLVTGKSAANLGVYMYDL